MSKYDEVIDQQWRNSKRDLLMDKQCFTEDQMIAMAHQIKGDPENWGGGFANWSIEELTSYRHRPMVMRYWVKKVLADAAIALEEESKS